MKKIRGYMVKSDAAPTFYAGDSIEDLMRGLQQIGLIEQMNEGDEITIKIKKFTPKQIAEMHEL